MNGSASIGVAHEEKLRTRKDQGRVLEDMVQIGCYVLMGVE